jgi:hypothetical protein
MINVVSKSVDPQVEENVPKKLSSTALTWNGFQVCRQILVPQTFDADSVDPEHRHLMTLLLSPHFKMRTAWLNQKVCTIYPRSSGEIAIIPNGVLSQPPSR